MDPPKVFDAEQILKALGVTNDNAFQWSRFVQKQLRRPELEGPGIVKAWIARISHGEQPCLVSKRSDDTYCSVTPSNMRAFLGEVTDPEVKEMFEYASNTATP